MINVTIYNEFIHERNDEAVKAVYPNGIHEAIKELLSEDKNFNIRTAVLEDISESLSDEVLDSTDVLFWWIQPPQPWAAPMSLHSVRI